MATTTPNTVQPSASVFVHINVIKRHSTSNVSVSRGGPFTPGVYQAKLPTNATNLSRSFAPAQLRAMTTNDLNMFFCHLTFQSDFPLRVKRPFSMIRTSWSDTESRIASEYRNCTACVRRDEGSRILRTTVLISDPKIR